jgi:hypothetical protein
MKIINDKSVVSVTLLISILSVISCTSIAQEERRPGVLKGIYTAEQVQRGADAFSEICRNCHIPRDFRTILQQSDDTTALIADYYDLIRLTMPQDSPGSLSEGMYLDVMAYLLSLNGFSATPE